MAFFDYTDPELAAQAMSVIISTIGGLILVVSAVMFFIVLIRAHRGPRVVVEEYRFSTAVHESKTIPVALNSFGLWLALMIGLTLFNYGYPIASLVSRSDTSVPAIPIGGPQR
jgi:cytochrome c oxidase subunit 1